MAGQTENKSAVLPDRKKMDSLSRLSGKLAHDLNNILGAIEGYATLALNSPSADAALKDDLQEIRKAVGRAAALNKQLLVFCGRQLLQRRPCGVNGIIEKLLGAGAGSVSPAVKVEPRLQPGLPDIEGDPVQLELVFLNLLANARDAMPGGGTAVISTELRRLEAAAVNSPRPGEAGTEFVRVCVRDSGTGLGADALEHLFEPLFSTKEKGKGAGFGLSAVYGIIKQHNGWAAAASAPGEGSEFSVFLPAAGPGKGPAAPDRTAK